MVSCTLVSSDSRITLNETATPVDFSTTINNLAEVGTAEAVNQIVAILVGNDNIKIASHALDRLGQLALNLNSYAIHAISCGCGLFKERIDAPIIDSAYKQSIQAKGDLLWSRMAESPNELKDVLAYLLKIRKVDSNLANVVVSKAEELTTRRKWEILGAIAGTDYGNHLDFQVRAVSLIANRRNDPEIRLPVLAGLVADPVVHSAVRDKALAGILSNLRNPEFVRYLSGCPATLSLIDKISELEPKSTAVLSLSYLTLNSNPKYDIECQYAIFRVGQILEGIALEDVNNDLKERLQSLISNENLEPKLKQGLRKLISEGKS